MTHRSAFLGAWWWLVESVNRAARPTRQIIIFWHACQMSAGVKRREHSTLSSIAHSYESCPKKRRVLPPQCPGIKHGPSKQFLKDPQSAVLLHVTSTAESASDRPCTFFGAASAAGILYMQQHFPFCLLRSAFAKQTFARILAHSTATAIPNACSCAQLDRKEPIMHDSPARHPGSSTLSERSIISSYI